MSRDRTVDVAALLAFVAVGAWLRLATLGDESLWYDEAVAWQISQGGWREILAANAANSSAPPLFPLLVGLLTGPGAGEAVLRAPSALAGILAIPVTWLLAREFLEDRWALVAPLLVALSPSQVEYAQEVREYAPSVLAACLLLLAHARFLRGPTPRRAVGLAVAAVAGLCVQYGIALLVAAGGVACLAAALRDERPAHAVRLLVAAHVPVAAVAALLWVTTLRTQLAHPAMSAGGYWYLLDRYWDGTLPDLVTLLTADRADIVHLAFPGKLMFLAVAAGIVAALLRPAWRPAAALTVLPVAVTLAAALAGAYPFGAIRQDLFLTPMLCVAAALGLAAGAGWLARPLGPVAGPATALLAVGLMAWTGAARSWQLTHVADNEPMREATALLAARLEPGESIYVHAGAVPAFRYYWRDREAPWAAGSPHAPALDPRRAQADLRVVHRELRELGTTGRPFWVVISHLDEADALEVVDGVKGSGIEVVANTRGAWVLRVTPPRRRP